MDKYLDSGWIAVYIALTLGLVQVFQVLNRRKRAIRYEVSPVNHLVSINENAFGAVEVFFHGRKVPDAAMLWLTVKNVGNSAIRATEITTPLGIRFPGAQEIISCHVEQVSPESLRDEVTISVVEERVQISPCMLNPDDMISVGIVVAGYKGHQAHGRIEGIRELKEVAPHGDRVGQRDIALGVGSLCVGGLGMMIITGQSSEQMLTLSGTAWNPLAVFGLLVVTALAGMRWVQARGKRK